MSGNPSEWDVLRSRLRQVEAERDKLVEQLFTERERCAKIADLWANSQSCSYGGPCEHIRTGAAIAARIRKGS